MTDYPAPVGKLLSLGEAHLGDWPDYPRRFGFGPEHVPDLIRMATDPELNLGDPDSDEVWAPVHAWRTLGQLRAEQAVEPLLRMLADAERDNDWVYEELPEVLAMIGLAALPALEAALADVEVDAYAREAAGRGLALIVEDHPETRERVVAALSRELERPGNEREFCGLLLATLLDMDAVEAAPVIERAFAAGRIEEGIAGDWPVVQYELGLTDTPPPRRDLGSFLPWGFPQGDASRPSRAARQKAKKRRKEAKKAKKRNRKKR